MTDKIQVSEPVICNSGDLENVTLFKRRYYVDGVPSGSLVYSVGGSLYEDVLIDAIKSINPLSGGELQQRIEREKSITSKQIFDEFYHQLSLCDTSDLKWQEVGVLIKIWMFIDLSDGHLDREIPVQEALAKWVNKLITLHLPLVRKKSD
ncbi:hypothetical protein [Serratia proteamaculans]|uniref:hypothetical protein n=1 Tax=Serratia proteamaculans TaxID=28151 RepID=UPI0021C99AA1|nr:hypothetical protein [Serratia proteamaculans]